MQNYQLCVFDNVKKNTVNRKINKIMKDLHVF